MKQSKTLMFWLGLVEATAFGCGSDNAPRAGTEPDAAVGGATSIAGATSKGGTNSTSSATHVGGVAATGGVLGAGGTSATGGVTATGGAFAAAGTNGTGGIAAMGGTVATGVSTATGGTVASGGVINTGTSANSGGTLATGGTPATGGTVAAGGTQAVDTSIAAGGADDAGNADDAGSDSGATGPAPSAVVLDAVAAGDSANWTLLDTASNPTVTIQEITSPYDSGVALQTTATGNTVATCGWMRTWRSFTLPQTMRSDTTALQLYLALDSDMTTYNFPGLEVVLYNSGDLVGYVMYYRADATGSFIMDRTGPWHAISSNGYQVLSISSMLDANDDPATVPVSFDQIDLFLINYTCVGNNSVIIDDVSLVPYSPS